MKLAPSPLDTFWQRIEYIVGPARLQDFDQAGQKETRSAIEAFTIERHPESVLDVGCNTGVEGYRLSEGGFTGQYIGIDSNRKGISLSKENLQCRPAWIILADAGALPINDQSIDLALSKDVIEHQEYYEPCVREQCRVAKSWVVLSMFIKPIDGNDKIVRHADGYFLNQYDRGRLLNFVSDQGFGLDSVVYEGEQDIVFAFSRDNLPRQRNKA